ncbi:HpcH/HpaI aldolase family protein [Occultella gossypii]|uniref:HpcH/HpaI aldolase/citrate lyase domain-containing protein n=1 Tax=Occultella gossypii TaxID=2800820 RepID=A0ABS7SFI8_9MICO|nr:aldolase/citrate lyase family protein [Occultella gossypii]MBZ2198997.1 hypothetical protein [Occultella gossypii]
MLSSLAQHLRAGELALTIKVNLSDPQVCEIAALAGADAVWLDREHCVGDWPGLYHQILAARRRDTEAIVRVPRGSYSDIVKPYELGASAVMVPQIADLNDAAAVVAQAKFAPVGERALDGGNSDGDFGRLAFGDYMERAERDTLLILQLESPAAVEQADRIAALAGVDVVFFGPGDFAQKAGIPGQFGHADVLAAQEAVADAARNNGIVAGTVLHPGTSVESLVTQGFTLINVAADGGELRKALSNRIAAARHTAAPLLELSQPVHNA